MSPQDKRTNSAFCKVDKGKSYQGPKGLRMTLDMLQTQRLLKRSFWPDIKLILRKSKGAVQKNIPEIYALLSGRMRPFLTCHHSVSSFREVPVFVFHDVIYNLLDKQLYYLQKNGYQTLDADTLEEVIRRKTSKERLVALTFDDATWTFWTYVFPLLRKYHYRAILFVVAGMIPEDPAIYPTIEDVWAKRCSWEELKRRQQVQPFCTWRELPIMHESGLVDIQSHSLTHARVYVSSRLVDFLHPGFQTYYGNFDVPISILDSPLQPERKFLLGKPIFESAPRLAGRLRFKESPELVRTLRCYVEAEGGRAFFERPHWKKELLKLFRQWPAKQLGDFEPVSEMQYAIQREFSESKKILETRLANKQIRHFCYPWFTGSALADQFAAENGYQTLHYGLYTRAPSPPSDSRFPLQIRRISEEYLCRLPGEGRVSLSSIWINRLHHFF